QLQFARRIAVDHGHFLSGKSALAGMFADLPGVTVRLMQRGERAYLPPFENVTLRPGDLVIVAATRTALTDVFSSHPGSLEEIWRSRGGEESNARRQLAVAEAVIAPGSRMEGRTIEMLGFRRLTKAVVLGVQRRSKMLRARLSDIRLEAGDTLLICGPVEAVAELRNNRDLIVLEWSSQEIPVTTRAQAARLAAFGVVAAAASGIMPILHASVLGATTMVAAGCLNIRQASRALDIRIFLLVASALALGAALEGTGAAERLAMTMVDAVSPFGKLAVLSALFLLTAVLTNVLSNAATAVLFAPIALSAAAQTGSDPLPFILAVLYGANCCFATPIAYQTNLLVMGPGHYKFVDFLRFGGPLVLLLWAVFTLAAPWRFDL
ncbi:MAG: SLC13 family permease, partial [Pseudomonadota bacterium]